MTINAPASLLLLLYELVAEEQGVPGERLRGTVQNDILKEYAARGNYIFPPRPSMRLTTDLFAYCAERLPQLEHDLDLGLPHPRGRLDRRPGDRVHARERPRVLPRGRRGGALARRLRRAPLLLLQRPQRLLPGGGEVPGRAAAVGEALARAARRDEPAGARAPLPCPDRRVDADRPAAGEQHRAGRDPGALGGLRRRAVDPHELASTRRSRCRRERAARIALRTQQILQHEAGTTDTADPLGGAYFLEALTDELEARALELIDRVEELGGAVNAIEQGFVQGEIEEAAYRYTAQVESGERVVVGREPVPGGRGRADRAPPARPGDRAAPARAHRAGAGRAGRRGGRRGARGGAPRRRRRGATFCRRCARRSAPAARSARSAACSARSGACTTRSAADVRILLVSQMYPGPDDPDLGVFVARLEDALRERGHEVERAVVDRRAGGPAPPRAARCARLVPPRGASVRTSSTRTSSFRPGLPARWPHARPSS